MDSHDKYQCILHKLELLTITKDSYLFEQEPEAAANKLIIVFSGNAVYHIGTSSFAVKKGDVFVASCLYTQAISEAKQLQIFILSYRPCDIELYSFTRLAGYQQLFVENPAAFAYARNSILQTEPNLLKELYFLATNMNEEYERQEIGVNQILNSMFFALITLIARAKKNHNQRFYAGQSKFIAAVAYMQQHYQEELCIDDLAQIAQFSARHFSRKFKQIYKVSPTKYLMRLRVYHACSLLQETDLSITEISTRCGFADYSCFSTQFKTLQGVAPSIYRKIVQNI